MNENELFIYFCGTNEGVCNQLNYLSPKISARNQIYIRGLGADKFKDSPIYKKNKGIHKTVSTGRTLYDATNLYFLKYIDEINKDRKLTFIEPDYSNNANKSGYKDDDIRIVIEAISKVLNITAVKEKVSEDVIIDFSKVEKVVLCGHSRGAAVGLFRYLYELSDEIIIQNKDISILFLDPVAGQTGNEYYPIGGKSNLSDLEIKTTYLYQRLNTLSNLKNIVEIYARAAKFTNIPYLKSFNPARRFMYSHQDNENVFSRFFFTFTHSAMVNQKSDITPSESYRLIGDLINKCFEGIRLSKQKKIYQDIFSKQDDRTLERVNSGDDFFKAVKKGLPQQYASRHSLFENLEGKLYDLFKSNV